MVDHDALLSAFAEYAEALVGPYDVGHVLYRLTDQVVAVLGVDGAGVSIVRDDGRLTFVAATGARVANVEAFQESVREGPCHDAYRTGEQVTATDLHLDTRWPAFAPAGVEQDWRGVAGLPMPAAEHRIGALNLYTDEPHAWADDELAVGQVLANMASGYVLNRIQLDETRNVVGQLQHALDSRVVIEQAKGIVAVRRGVSPGQAFELLRTRARSTNTRLHEVCRCIVDSAS